MEETLVPLANVNHNQNQPTNQQRETTDQNKEQQIASAAVPDSVRRLTDGCGIISLSLFSSYKVNCAAQSILPCHAAEPCCCWCRKKRRREKEKRSRSDKVVSLSLFFFFHFFDSRARLRRIYQAQTQVRLREIPREPHNHHYIIPPILFHIQTHTQKSEGDV
jgi:hypothetical protein